MFLLTFYLIIGLVWAMMAFVGNLRDPQSRYSSEEHILYFFFTAILWIIILPAILWELYKDRDR